VRYSEELNKKKALLDFAQAAPALEDFYKADFVLLATECLIKAIESRLAPAGQRQAAVDQAFSGGVHPYAGLRRGAARLREAGAVPAVSTTSELVKAIDLNREDQRLAAVVFVSERPARPGQGGAVDSRPSSRGAGKPSRRRSGTIPRRGLRPGQDRLSEGTQGNRRAATARQRPTTGWRGSREQRIRNCGGLFEKTLTSSPDAEVQAWSHVYLGRAGRRPLGSASRPPGITRRAWMSGRIRTPRARRPAGPA